MTLDWKLLKRLILTYLVVWIPLMLVSVLQTWSSVENGRMQTQASIRMNVRQTASEMSALLSTYNINSSTLSNAPELRKSVVTASMTGAYNGIQLLKYATIHDGYVTNTFLCYGTGNVYSASGLTGTQTYLRRTLGLADTANAMEVLEDEQYRVVPFWNSGQSGFLLLHCPVGGDVSVNYVLPFVSAQKLLSRLWNGQIEAVQLRFSDDQSLWFDRKGLLAEHDSCMDMEAISCSVVHDTLTLCAYYRPNHLVAEAEQYQRHNVLLMLTGFLLSVFSTLCLSSRQMRHIQQLEDTIRKIAIAPEDEAASTMPSDEYLGLRRLAGNVREQYHSLSTARQLYQEEIRRQALKALIHHWYMDGQELDNMMKLSGVALCEEYFVVGAVVLPENSMLMPELMDMFREDLCCEEMISDKRLFCFLQELPNQDADGRRREQLSQEIWRLQPGGEQARIVFSPVFHDLSMVNYAWQRLVAQLRDSSGQSEPISMQEIWDELPQDSAGENCALREQLLAALYNGKIAKAQQMVGPVCAGIEALECSGNDKNTLRYELTNRILGVIHDRMPEEENCLPEEVEAFEYSDAVRFLEQLQALLRKIEDKTPQDTFDRALKYMAANYTDSYLSADQVAEHIGINKTYMSRLFKSHTGMSYIQYLTKLRMEKAKMLLKTTDMAIHDIVLAVGYLDDSSFRKKFKELFGITVAEYRK